MKNKQLIVSIGREYGSGGHIIAEKIAERFELPLYDKNILSEVALKRNLNLKDIEKYDEVPKMKVFSRTVRGFSNSPEVNIANIQFDYMRELAEKGESFVIVGRCSEEILKDYPGLITIFVLGDYDFKVKLTQKINGNVTYDEAEEMIYRQDKQRKAYHNYFCKGKWGDSRNYDLSVKSSTLGLDDTVDFIEGYIQKRIEKMLIE
jgi:cytidylate kinase